MSSFSIALSISFASVAVIYTFLADFAFVLALFGTATFCAGLPLIYSKITASFRIVLMSAA